MSLKKLTHSFPWSRYSKKMIGKIEHPRSLGIFSKEQAEERGMFLAEGDAGSFSEGNKIHFYWLVDPDDGIIVDVRFQLYGQSALIGAAEAVSDLLIGKNYDQARRITSELIDKQVRDRSDEVAFPKETSPHLNLVLEALDHASETCQGLPLADNYVVSPTPSFIGEVLEGGYPGWETLSLTQKLALIEEVVARDVRPYIELDAGGVEILDLKNEWQVLIAYQGSCTTCFSATGTTLSYIQQVLRAKVHPNLEVIPNL